MEIFEAFGAGFIPIHSRKAVLLAYCGPRSKFIDDGNYYATTLHKLRQCSGDEKRLNRDLKNRFGTQAAIADDMRSFE